MRTTESIIQDYQIIIENAQKELTFTTRQIRNISLLRVALFIEAVGAAWYCWNREWIYLVLFSLLPLILFMWLVKRHNRWFHRKDYLKQKIEINQQEIAALKQNDLSAFDGGWEYIEPTHPYTFDLDVFGDHSLFQCINRTSTAVGKKRLAEWLNLHCSRKEEIENRQETVQELSQDLHFLQQFRIFGLLFKGEPTDETTLHQWVNAPSYFRKRNWIRLAPIFVTLLNATCIGSSLWGVLPGNIAGLVFVTCMLVSFIFTQKITGVQIGIAKKLQILSTYAQQIKLIEEKQWEAKELKRIQQNLNNYNEQASQAVNRLSRMMNTLDQRNNLLVSSVLNGLMFWELRQIIKIEEWKEIHATDLPKWLETIAEVDAYASLAQFAYNHPDYIFPQINNEPFVIEAQAMGHPLMKKEKCVKNDLQIKKCPYFIIITGANMAGKSTYLRTIGCNYLLGCIGAPVWAEKMQLTPVQLITSLRTSDSLTDNESYFFAELKRLKGIIDRLQNGERLFIILDEILKGTNSVDKQKGSLALVKQFIHLQTNGIIATHDLLLSTLAESFPENIHNQCFEADIINNELSFSYQMREGVAQNMNACFLMKKMGIAVIDN